MKNYIILVSIFAILGISACQSHNEEHHSENKFLVTNPIKKDTLNYNNYVCQIHAYQHIELRALEKGYLQKILVDEGEVVKQGQLLFQIQPTIYEAEMQKAKAEVERAQIEYSNTKSLADSNIVSDNELSLAKVNLNKAKAELALMQAHLSFTEIRAPFSGIVGKFEDVRLGSLLDEGELLTTLSDNSQMWVYFNVPEAVYLDYAQVIQGDKADSLKLQLANNSLFQYSGYVTAIESDFNNTTGTIPFRATFQNPDRLLRHGQTGNILWPVDLTDALIIPQKATFEILDKKFVFVINDGIVRSQEIKIAAELDHLYVIESGLDIRDSILLEGLRKVQNGDHVSTDYLEPSQVYGLLELHAE